MRFLQVYLRQASAAHILYNSEIQLCLGESACEDKSGSFTAAETLDKDDHTMALNAPLC